MDKISISSILSIPVDNIVGNFGAASDTPKKKTIKSEIDDIIKLNQTRHDYKLKIYRKTLRDCILKIKRENENRKTDTFYKIAEFVYGHPEYDAEECIEYVMIELKKFFLDVTKYNPTTIFITWKFLQFHKRS